MRAVPRTCTQNIWIEWDDAATMWPPQSGGVLRLGAAGAALRVTFPCEPCSKGAESAGVPLNELSRAWKRRASRGLLTTVLSAGSVAVGDEVRLETGCFAPLESEHPARVRDVLQRLPRGRVLTWTQLAALAGAPTGFSMRGMPGLLKRAQQHGAPAHRVVDSAWTTIPRHLPDQRALLEAEGVRVCADSGRLLEERAVAWAPDHGELYLCDPSQVPRGEGCTQLES